jgi:hypothetical protein
VGGLSRKRVLNPVKNIGRDSFARIARYFSGHENDAHNVRRQGATRAYACLVGGMFGESDTGLRVPLMEPDHVAKMPQSNHEMRSIAAKYR